MQALPTPCPTVTHCYSEIIKCEAPPEKHTLTGEASGQAIRMASFVATCECDLCLCSEKKRVDKEIFLPDCAHQNPVSSLQLVLQGPIPVITAS